MTNANKPAIVDDILVADLLLRIQALQNLLVKKLIISDAEFQNEIKLVSRPFLKVILEKANVLGNLDQLIDDLEIIHKDK
jgi:hypothetical protein